MNIGKSFCELIILQKWSNCISYHKPGFKKCSAFIPSVTLINILHHGDCKHVTTTKVSYDSQGQLSMSKQFLAQSKATFQ